jgi:hypothetical protein
VVERLPRMVRKRFWFYGNTYEYYSNVLQACHLLDVKNNTKAEVNDKKTTNLEQRATSCIRCNYFHEYGLLQPTNQ